MSEPEKTTRRFVVDTNVFVAAIRPFSKPAHTGSRDTKTLGLLVKLIVDDRLALVASSTLLSEYRRLAEELKSETSNFIVDQLISKANIIEVRAEALKRCESYLPKGESADVVHAATGLQADGVLITNDRDFDRIKQSGIVEVWSISEAIRKLL